MELNGFEKKMRLTADNRHPNRLQDSQQLLSSHIRLVRHPQKQMK